MTLTPGKRKLCGISGMTYLTAAEKKEVEEFMAQFGGQFIVTEKEDK